MICDLTDLYDQKIDIFLMLANCSKIIGNYKLAVIFCRKALQYSWLYSDYEKEVMVYDKMGIIYFLDGQVKKASYYHKR